MQVESKYLLKPSHFLELSDLKQNKQTKKPSTQFNSNTPKLFLRLTPHYYSIFFCKGTKKRASENRVLTTGTENKVLNTGY